MRRILKQREKSTSPYRPHRPVRVLIADDHCLFLEAIHRLLRRHGFKVVALASDGHDAVRLALTTRPDIAVLDVMMPTLGGIDVTRQLLDVAPDTGVVLVTGSTDLRFVLEGMKLGVRGFVVKTAPAEEFFDAVRAAARGATYMSPAYQHEISAALPRSRATDITRLTARERQVLRLIAEGKTTKAIGAALGIAAKTADAHRTRLMKKLDIHDIAGLVRYAVRERLAAV
jgi:DNA-binding NarL/FixJ family response regulator